MPLDLIEAEGLSHAGNGQKLADVPRQVRVGDHLLLVALKKTEVHGVEADQGWEQPPVRESRLVADEPTGVRQAGGSAVKGLEEVLEADVVGCLTASEAAAVDAAVDVRVDQLVDLIDLGP